jgi:hypothetical protein
MAQYDMYSKTRIPAEGADYARKTPFSESRHCIVMRNGHVSICREEGREGRGEKEGGGKERE